MSGKRLNCGFFSRDARIVAKDLLGKTLIRKLKNKILKARIVETEAYLDENDPGSRARQNGDLRKTMQMSPGTILVYGVHNNWLVNFVTGRKDKPEAVLLRALEPLNFKANCSGPGLLTKSFEIKKDFHKKKVCNGNDLWIEESIEKHDIKKSFRIGLREDSKEKMRFYIKENPFLSRK